MKNKKKGFTLVELLVVIAILAVLASVSVVGYVGFTTKAKQSACIQEAKQAQTVIYAGLLETKEVSVKEGTTTYTAKLDGTKFTVTQTTDATTDVSPDNLDGVMTKLFTDLADLDKKDTTEFKLTDGVLSYSSNGHSVNIPLDGSKIQ